MGVAKLITSTELNENQLNAVQLMASGKRGKMIATELHVTEETVLRWRQLPAFEAAVNTLLLDAQEATRDRLRALAVTAVDTVEQVLNDQDIPPRDRLNAAFKILELCNFKDRANERIGPCDVRDVEKHRFMEDR